MPLPFLRVLPVLALAACSTPDVALGPDSDPGLARNQLREAAAQGPVRLEVNGLPATTGGALSAEAVARAAAQGVVGIPVTFAEDPALPVAPRLVLLFDPGPNPVDPDFACSRQALPAVVPSSGPLELQAVFCSAPLAVASAKAASEERTPAAAERLIWRTTRTLFPDDYDETYGFNLFGWRVRPGASASF